MILTLNELNALGKTLDFARQVSPGGRKSTNPTYPDYAVFQGEGQFCLEFFKNRPDGDPPSVHGRSQLGVDPATGETSCAACARGL